MINTITPTINQNVQPFRFTAGFLGTDRRRETGNYNPEIRERSSFFRERIFAQEVNLVEYHPGTLSYGT